MRVIRTAVSLGKRVERSETSGSRRGYRFYAATPRHGSRQLSLIEIPKCNAGSCRPRDGNDPRGPWRIPSGDTAGSSCVRATGKNHSPEPRCFSRRRGVLVSRPPPRIGALYCRLHLAKKRKRPRPRRARARR